MEKDRFFNLTKQIKTGERVRVIFELLMECIEASPDEERVDFWGKLKAKMVAEQEAIQELTKSSMDKPKQVSKKRATSAQELSIRKDEEPSDEDFFVRMNGGIPPLDDE